MAKLGYKKLVLKIGTQVITKDNGKLDLPVMGNIVEQIITLKNVGIEMIVVSSGAMGAGREIVKDLQVKDDVSKRQVLAAVGQAELMSVYKKLFGAKTLCAQVLATREDFKDTRHYANMSNCFSALLRQGVVPIVNENDVVAVDELMFTDNDELAGLIATMMKVDALLMLSAVDGIYINGSKEIIRLIESDTKWQSSVLAAKSMFGRGGMNTKGEVAHKLANLGIVTHIINGKLPNIVVDLVIYGQELGTKFVAQRSEQVSGIKRRIGWTRGQERGQVWVDKRAEDILLSGRAVSLLPVGITKVEGEFTKGDLVKIKNAKGKIIGLGMVQYDSTKARSYLRQKNKQELIHYNYLLINC